MHRGRFIFAAVLALVTASAQAATVVNTDFTLQDPARSPSGWVTNGTAGLDLDPSATPQAALALTHNLGNESGTAWTLLQANVPSFSMIADVNINFTLEFPANCPADGFTMAFAQTAPTAVGGGGGALALYGNEEVVPRFIAFEVNTWRDQAIDNRETCEPNTFTTFGFGNVNADTGVGRTPGEAGTPEAGGAKVGQANPPAGLRIVNGGWYRYQWNVEVASRRMTTYITGLEAGNNTVQNVKIAEVTFGADAPALNFTGRWGLTAATGGAVQGTRIAQVRIEVPMVAPPTTPPAAGP